MLRARAALLLTLAAAGCAAAAAGLPQGAPPEVPSRSPEEPAAASTLPAALRESLARAQIDPAGSAFVVLPLDGGALRLAVHADTPLNPASTMKLLTTYAALATLGPDYRWRTRVYASQPLRDGRLAGDLIVRGAGDPSLVIERWWLLVQRLRAGGLRRIDGDLVLDRSRYGKTAETGAAIDDHDLRPYNVPPDALLINFRAQSFEFQPDPEAGVARIVATPLLDGVRVPAQVPLRKGPCGDWKTRLRADFSVAAMPHFAGSYAASCGVRTWYVSRLGADEYALASFRALWRASGGEFHGTVRSGRAGAHDILLADQPSPPLAEVIRDINKNSNNVMARQLFLALGGRDRGATPAADERPPDERPPDERPPDKWPPDERPPGERPPEELLPGERPPEVRPPELQRLELRPPDAPAEVTAAAAAQPESATPGTSPVDLPSGPPSLPAAAAWPQTPERTQTPAPAGDATRPDDEEAPATARRSIEFLRGWLAGQGLSMPELVLQNGSGLSRVERISAASMGRLLRHAWRSNDMPNFLASLPLAGVDGTMEHRHGAEHAAYVKTGTLAEVRALAGYVFAASGRRYAIVALVNDPHAAAAQDALDDFLQWVWMRG